MLSEGRLNEIKLELDRQIVRVRSNDIARLYTGEPRYYVGCDIYELRDMLEVLLAPKPNNSYDANRGIVAKDKK